MTVAGTVGLRAAKRHVELQALSAVVAAGSPVVGYPTVADDETERPGCHRNALGYSASGESADMHTVGRRFQSHAVQMHGSGDTCYRIQAPTQTHIVWLRCPSASSLAAGHAVSESAPEVVAACAVVGAVADAGVDAVVAALVAGLNGAVAACHIRTVPHLEVQRPGRRYLQGAVVHTRASPVAAAELHPHPAGGSWWASRRHNSVADRSETADLVAGGDVASHDGLAESHCAGLGPVRRTGRSALQSEILRQTFLFPHSM